MMARSPVKRKAWIAVGPEGDMFGPSCSMLSEEVAWENALARLRTYKKVMIRKGWKVIPIKIYGQRTRAPLTDERNG